MKVIRLRQTLEAVSGIYERVGRKNEAEALRKLSRLLAIADQEQVSAVIAKLKN